MARITKGILGGFSGKVGTVVGAGWRGQDIIRSTPKPSSRRATGRQVLQQLKFRLVIGFLKPLSDIQSRYFGSASGSKSRVNLAVSYTISEAVEVVADVPELVYSKVLITKGEAVRLPKCRCRSQGGKPHHPDLAGQFRAGQRLGYGQGRYRLQQRVPRYPDTDLIRH